MVGYSCANDCQLPGNTKKCVKTYTTSFKLYKVCCFRLYKVCPCCGCEFDYHYFDGECPGCRDNDDPPPQPGFVFFPELLLATSPLALFPELAFYP